MGRIKPQPRQIVCRECGISFRGEKEIQGITSISPDMPLPPGPPLMPQ